MRPPKSKSHIILDFDRTIATMIIDWQQWHIGVGEIFKKYDPGFDLHLSKQRVHEYQNPLFAKYGPALKKEVDAYVERYELDNTRAFTPIPQAISLIRTSKSLLYIWSSNSEKIVRRGLEELKIRGRFTKVITRNDVLYIKPKTDGFSLIYDGGDKSKYLFVGDSTYDRDAAAGCGIDYLDVLDLRA